MRTKQHWRIQQTNNMNDNIHETPEEGVARAMKAFNKMVLDHPDTYVTTFDGVKHYANDTIKTYQWGKVVECDIMYKS